MKRTAAELLLAAVACAFLACGKYGPPVRADKSDAPATSESEQKDEAAQ